MIKRLLAAALILLAGPALAAGSFNGSTSTVYYSSTAMPTTPPLSLACWVKPSSNAAISTAMGVNEATAATTNFFNLNLTTTLQVRAVTNSTSLGGNSASTTGTGTVNTWFHGAATYTGTNNRRAHYAGTSRAQDTGTNAITGVTLDRIALGVRGTATAAQWFPGLLYGCAGWNGVALTDEETTALAQGWSPTRIRRYALAFYAPMKAGTTWEMHGISGTATAVSASADGPPMMH